MRKASAPIIEPATAPHATSLAVTSLVTAVLAAAGGSLVSEPEMFIRIFHMDKASGNDLFETQGISTKN
jgi:hypothetical protein